MNEREVIKEAEGELERLRLTYARKVAAAEKVPGDLLQWAERRLSQARDAAELAAAFDQLVRDAGTNKRRRLAACRAVQAAADRIGTSIFSFSGKRELNLVRRNAAALESNTIHADPVIQELRDKIERLERTLATARGDDLTLRDRPGGPWAGGGVRILGNRVFGGRK